jgi:hypothetical protein
MRLILLAAALSIAMPASAATLGQTSATTLSAAGCAKLTTLSIDADRIGLPTHGAHVSAATMVPAADRVPAHCLVEAEIMPVDPAAPAIHFAVALPLTWTGRSLAMGGGGFNGQIPPITAPIFGGLATPPLARGYAVFGGDSGHQEHPATPGDFMTNAEALRNYMGDSIKKTHDAALAVMRAAYGRVPSQSYFVGGSTGGREALWAAGRWPADWNGVMSYFPARGITTMLGTLRIDQAFSKPGAFIPPAKRALLLEAADEACDGLDGLKDGLIANRRACEARFDPAHATYQGRPLRCPDGSDDGDACLSDKQLAALAIMQGPVRFDYALSGDSVFPGYTAYTSDLGRAMATPMDLAVLIYGLGAMPPAYPVKPGMSGHYSYDADFLKYGVLDGQDVDPLTFDPEHPGRYAPRLYELSKADTFDQDLSGFAARGGKLIILHGEADTIVSVRMTERYVARLKARMGETRVDGFLRFYEVPGYSHGVSNTFNASWDFLTALENWSEHGADPGEGQVMTDMANRGRSRPLCLYPHFARYKGKGDPDAASSFVCASR